MPIQCQAKCDITLAICKRVFSETIGRSVRPTGRIGFRTQCFLISVPWQVFNVTSRVCYEYLITSTYATSSDNSIAKRAALSQIRAYQYKLSQWQKGDITRTIAGWSVVRETLLQLFPPPLTLGREPLQRLRSARGVPSRGSGRHCIPCQYWNNN